jgi:multiple sugar transport system permease protein
MSALQATPLAVRERSWWQSPLARREAFAGLLCLLPWILGFIAFTAGPLFFSTYVSFTDYRS